ncbi:hypothetical protein [uncultured Methylibium sp.]|uniref:hypothetical protein n=1 Tax=uncultured Methylibium sp. TaxID=381093 RepID=UPI0025FF3EE8|nr:hypothetical protein [uncultured Methylibium sp.]
MSMARLHRLADLPPVFALLLATLSSSIWARLYYQNNSAGFLAIVLSASMLLPAVLLLSVSDRSASRCGRGLVVAAVTFFTGVVATGGTLARSPIAGLLIAAMVTGALAAGLSAAWIQRAWPRLRIALTAGGLLFFLAAPAGGWLGAEKRAFLPPVAADARVPTVWLLLDETSFGAAEGLVQPLREAGLWTAVHALEPAGDNTLDVLPSIIVRARMGPATAPCSLTAVCARSRSVDFARVGVGRPDVDLIGIHHPYCAMQGWRTCLDTRAAPTWSDQFEALRCAARRRLPGRADCVIDDRARELALRARLISAFDQAPFWSEGGDLYAHLPLPHLPASEQALPSLAEAYELNLALAAKLVESAARRLQERFPGRFRLVIFADHPLRAMPNCGEGYGHRCERPARYAQPYRVPLIVAAPAELPLVLPTSNAGVLDVLGIDADSAGRR